MVVMTSRKCQSNAIEDDYEDWHNAKTGAQTDPRYCLVPSCPVSARFARGRCLSPLFATAQCSILYPHASSFKTPVARGRRQCRQ
jgi:hypothetical protein